MKLLIRISFSVLILLIVVAGLAIVGLMIFMDPNKLKPVLIEETMKKTGYQLTIDGPLSWSFYPRLSVKVDHMELKSPTQTSTFLTLHHVAIAANFSELFKGKENLQGDVYIDQI